MENITKEQLDGIISRFNFEPNYGRLIATLNTIEYDSEKVTTDETALDAVQFVVASGERVQYKPGDKVLLDLEKLSVLQRSTIDATNAIPRLNITAFEFEDKIFAIIDENKILGKYTQ